MTETIMAAQKDLQPGDAVEGYTRVDKYPTGHYYRKVFSGVIEHIYRPSLVRVRQSNGASRDLHRSDSGWYWVPRDYWSSNTQARPVCLTITNWKARMERLL